MERPAVRLKGYRLMVCGECRGWTLLPRPTWRDQAALHDNETYFDHPYLVHRRSFAAAVDRRCAAIFRQIAKFVDVPGICGQRMLDVGCDVGLLLSSAARQFGVVPVGIDVSQRAAEQARANGIEAYACRLEDAPPHLRDFPLVTAIDLIEHVADPGLFFRSLAERVRPGGIFYVETPNPGSSVFQVGRILCTLAGCRPSGAFHRLYPPEHVQYYTREGLRCVARSSGLEIVAIGSRVLPAREIAVSWPVRFGLMPLQAADIAKREMALMWSILIRPRRAG